MRAVRKSDGYSDGDRTMMAGGFAIDVQPIGPRSHSVSASDTEPTQVSLSRRRTVVVLLKPLSSLTPAPG